MSERMLLGEIKGDGEGFPEDKSIVVDGRKPSVGIDGEKFGSARAGGADLGRNVLVRESELLCEPERAERARARP